MFLQDAPTHFVVTLKAVRHFGRANKTKQNQSKKMRSCFFRPTLNRTIFFLNRCRREEKKLEIKKSGKFVTGPAASLLVNAESRFRKTVTPRSPMSERIVHRHRIRLSRKVVYSICGNKDQSCDIWKYFLLLKFGEKNLVALTRTRATWGENFHGV
jgi:hypothetical protein